MRHIFIINPAAGKKNCDEQMRGQINTLCSKYNIEPLIFTSEYPGYEREMTERICELFPEERLRFYSIGGSGTLTNIVSGIKDYSMTEVACLPAGLSNDLLKSYGETRKHFNSLENLINGKVDMLDMIDVNGYKTLDFGSVGLGNSCFNDSLFFRLISFLRSTMNYVFGIILDIMNNRCAYYNLTVDGKDFSGEYAMITCFNGMCMGGRYMPLRDPRPNDGVLTFLTVKKMNTFQQLKVYISFLKGEISRVRNDITLFKGTEMQISRADKKDIVVNCDGECVVAKNIVMKVAKDKLRFVVPKESIILEPTDLDEV